MLNWIFVCFTSTQIIINSDVCLFKVFYSKLEQDRLYITKAGESEW